jgi:hypothetical protein
VNPLGAGALYLFKDGQDTLYRLHGTVEPWSIGKSMSSGCIRLLNQDIVDLYGRVPTGSKVVVLDHQPRKDLPIQSLFEIWVNRSARVLPANRALASRYGPT